VASVLKTKAAELITPSALFAEGWYQLLLLPPQVRFTPTKVVGIPPLYVFLLCYLLIEYRGSQ
jgi:hypothetical protein